MPYNTPTFATIRERMLRDIRNLDADAHVEHDSDHFIRACAVASASEGLYDHQQWIARQILPDTADPEYLEQHCALRGITRKPATQAQGVMSLEGKAGATVPAGTEARNEKDQLFYTLQAGIVDENGRVEVPCRARKPGAMPDADAMPLTLVSAPSGIQGKALLAIAGGTEAESNASLLSRLLYYMQNPPGGGNVRDYHRWAKETPGVANATVYPLRQGVGTVDIVITGEDGIPSSDIVEACQAHIDALRPATAMVFVFAPIPLAVNMHWKLSVNSAATIESLQGTIIQVLESRFGLLSPGDTLILAKLLAAVAGIGGITDAEIVSPANNVTVSPLEWARLGTVTLEAL